MKITVHVPCPLCGHVNVRAVDVFNAVMPLQVWYCEVETGGCDKQFGVLFTLEPHATTYTLSEGTFHRAVNTKPPEPCDPPSSTEVQPS